METWTLQAITINPLGQITTKHLCTFVMQDGTVMPITTFSQQINPGDTLAVDPSQPTKPQSIANVLGVFAPITTALWTPAVVNAFQTAQVQSVQL